MEITRCETGTAGRLVLNLSATVLYRSSWQYEAWHCCVKWWHSGTATQTFLQQMACHNLSVHHNNGQQLVSPQLTKFTRRTTLWCKMTVVFSSLLMALLHISLLGEIKDISTLWMLFGLRCHVRSYVSQCPPPPNNSLKKLLSLL